MWDDCVGMLDTESGQWKMWNDCENTSDRRQSVNYQGKN